MVTTTTTTQRVDLLLNADGLLFLKWKVSYEQN